MGAGVAVSVAAPVEAASALAVVASAAASSFLVHAAATRAIAATATRGFSKDMESLFVGVGMVSKPGASRNVPETVKRLAHLARGRLYRLEAYPFGGS
jgi:hypothetical protein